VSERNKTLANFSALGTFLLIVVIAWQTNAFPLVINELSMFATGNYRQVAMNHTTFLMMFSVILAVVAIELPCAAAAAFLQAVILGKSGKHAVREMFDNMEYGNHFFTFFGIVLLEELFARWFFLGVLTKISALSGTIQFYTLFFIGNLIWALVHLSNFKETKDWHILRVLPQFVSGGFLTYVFVKYGLLATILAHFAFNAILFATHKLNRVTIVDGIIVAYSAVCAAISFWLMDKPISDVLPWFENNPTFVLKGWEFGDYLALSVFLSSIASIIFGLLLYDQKTTENDDTDSPIIASFIGIPVALGLLYGMFALLGCIISDVPFRILVIVILFTCLIKSTSGSGISRTFWGALPELYVTVCIVQALGFWPAAGWFALSSLISFPVTFLRRVDA
jgi:hypothetical protein